MHTQLYQDLGVTPTATQAQIKQAWRNLSSIHHPDKGGSEEQMAKLNQAYKILKDAKKRAHYDRTGQVGEDDPEEYAKKMLVKVVQQCLSEEGNIVTLMRNFLNKSIDEGSMLISKVTKELQINTKRLDAIKGPVDEHNIIADALKAHVAKLEHVLTASNKEMASVKRAREMLDHYSSTEAAPKPKRDEEDFMSMLLGAAFQSHSNPFEESGPGPNQSYRSSRRKGAEW